MNLAWLKVEAHEDEKSKEETQMEKGKEAHKKSRILLAPQDQIKGRWCRRFLAILL